MLEQQHHAQPVNKNKNQKIILISIISIGTLAIAVIWILSSLAIIPGFLATIISIVFTVFGVIIALLAVINPVQAEISHVLHLSPQLSEITKISQTLIPPAPSGPLPLTPPHRGIIGFPLPTNARVIQQRQGEVAAIYEQLIQPDTTAIVLTGIGGAGKSTLAALLLHYAETQRHLEASPFTAPALWLHIDPAVTMIDLAGTLFEISNKPLFDFTTLSPQQQATRLFQTLNSINEPRLIILDQFENLLDWQTGYTLPARPGIGEWLDALNSQPCQYRILLTSRIWPRGTHASPSICMQEYSVPGLTLPEGIDLLQKQGVQGTDAELQRAVEYCEGHAFSLALLASLTRHHSLNLFSLFRDPAYTQFWRGNIAQNFLDYIYKQQLDRLQRKLLSAFSVYREAVPLDAARAVMEGWCETAMIDITSATHVLLTQHLLQAAGNGAYQLHSLVASYAQDHLIENNEQANQELLYTLHERASLYYQQLAITTCPTKKHRRSISDIHPFLEAVWHYCQAEQRQEAYNLMKQENIFSALKRWGDNAALLELCHLLLQPSSRQLEGSSLAHVYNNLGDVCWVLGRVEQAQHYYNQTLRQQNTDLAEEAWARSNLGRIYNTLGNSKLAQEYLEIALHLFRNLNDQSGEGKCIINLGWVCYDLGDMTQAQHYFERALSLFKEREDLQEEGLVSGYLGRMYSDMGQEQLAHTYYKQALKILRVVGDRNGEGIILCNLGRISSSLGQHQQALEYLELALHILEEVGDRNGEGTALNDLGMIYANLGQQKQAQDYLERALHIRQIVGNRRGEARALTDLGRLCMDTEQVEQARDYFEQALHILGEIDHGWREARTLKSLGKVYLSLGQKDQALQCYEKALHLYTQIGNRWQEGILSFEIGLLYLAQNRYNIAIAFFTLAQNIDNEVKNEYENKIHEQLDLISSKMKQEHFVALIAEATQLVKQMGH